MAGSSRISPGGLGEACLVHWDGEGQGAGLGKLPSALGSFRTKAAWGV